ncbi:MAG: VWA domain-containing protein, partial [Bacteroidaceae bacterium]
PNDNIGITVFAGEAFTQCPMTTDHTVLLNLFKNVSCDLVLRGLIEDRTAIGMGLANSISRLKDSKAKSKTIILLTDGINNRGDISPLTAAEIAKKFGIRIYTIGVGTNGEAPYPYPLPGGGIHYINTKVEIDTRTLTAIAEMTDGQFYRATSNKRLAQIYQDIDKLEKTKLHVKNYSKRYESYQLFGLIAMFSLLLELFLRVVVLRRLP